MTGRQNTRISACLSRFRRVGSWANRKVTHWGSGFHRVSSYVVLARKWRPSQFSDIVGQGHIVRTLMNAIRSERVHHAYLLTGSRGIGKTSIARIFAKALRCEAATWTTEGYLKSCDQCSSCREITSTTSVDVQEIDGASNNGVDEIREIHPANQETDWHPELLLLRGQAEIALGDIRIGLVFLHRVFESPSLPRIPAYDPIRVKVRALMSIAALWEKSAPARAVAMLRLASQSIQTGREINLSEVLATEEI